ncbi:hypothetical protein P389DRAFT_196773 [Cystobasidium minutum MCA 4210]|uniref:uncharacterized protein n=1 Tax=Cystobasidium minutum MCA 4210 TaxID=1397322 RepID=UPI0034CE1965|eukprot:jgi/Rhomi1/196773/gm1.4987_g
MSTPRRPSRASIAGGEDVSSSSRFSTPLQHNAVTRLRGNRTGTTSNRRASYDPSSSVSTSTSTSTPCIPRSSSFVTPSRASSSGSSSGHHSHDPFTASPSPRTPIQGTPSRRKGGLRIVKVHKPWYERLARLPGELWDRYELQLNELILTDLQELDDWAYPIGFATLALHFFLRVTVGASSAFTSNSTARKTSSSSKVGRYANSAEARLEELRLSTQGRLATWGRFKTLIYRSTTLLCWLVILLSFLNALWLFTNRRKYRLFMQDNTVNSPNAKIVRMTTPTQTDGEDDGPDETEARKPSLASRAFQAIKTALRRRSTDRRPQDVQELSVWDPPTFALRFFAVYSPPMALLVHFLDRSNFLTFFVAASFLSLQTYLIIHSFTQMMADRQTVNSEVMHEYNAKFVAPRVFYARRDASTMTNEAEIIDIHAYRKERRESRQHEYANDASTYY